MAIILRPHICDTISPYVFFGSKNKIHFICCQKESFPLPIESWYLCSDCVADVIPQLLEDSCGRTAYQPSVRILKRDRAADATSLANQLVFVHTCCIEYMCFIN